MTEKTIREQELEKEWNAILRSARRMGEELSQQETGSGRGARRRSSAKSNKGRATAVRQQTKWTAPRLRTRAT